MAVQSKWGLSATTPQPKRYVGIGASAGGLQALEELFDNLDAETGMAFFVIQHLSPDFDSLMDKLISRHTRMHVELITDAVEIRANCIYLLPPGKEAIMSGTRLLLTDRSRGDGGLSFPIDEFFRSVAHAARERSVGIILSGTGTDGSRGIQEVYRGGGLVMAQSVETAAFDGMPRAACDTGTTSLILSPLEIARTLNRLGADADEETIQVGIEPEDRMLPSMRLIFNLLHNRYGLDFSYYKAEMIIRRIERRANLSTASDVDSYVRLLESNQDEVELLYHDMLIGVTDFFRDHQVFERLQLDAISGLIEKLGSDEEIRCWIAGTATGEEAYTVAMLLTEEMEKLGAKRRVRIFASDVHEGSLQRAGRGVYLEDQMHGVTPERRKRFFIERQDGFYVAPELRKMIVFTPHNMIHDAPFTRLDLICCRNVMIYFTPQTQQRVLSLLHFGLKTGGILCLGNSESLGDMRNEFQPLDESLRIFRKHRELSPGMRAGKTPSARWIPSTNHVQARERSEHRRLLSVYDEVLQLVGTPAIVVSESREILHVVGGAGMFLQVNDGRPTRDLLQTIKRELRSVCSLAIMQFRRDRRSVEIDPVTCQLGGKATGVLVRADAITVEEDESAILLRFECQEVNSGDDQHIKLSSDQIDTIEQLERELHFTQDNLQSTIEELQTTNEELQSTNEQLTASNEELQSTNEELHSVNEELYTVNAEHQRKIDELTELNDDIDNLLTTTNVHTLFLDSNMKLRRFTPHLADFFNLIPQDIGRPISSFTHKLIDVNLVQCIGEVIETEKPYHREVKDEMDRWYLLRIFPYLARGIVDGVVVTLVNVTTLQTATEALQKSEERFNLAVSGSNAGIWDWKDVREEPIWCSGRMYSILGRSPNEEMAISLWQELVHPDDRDQFERALVDHLRHAVPFDIEFRMETANSKGYRWFHMRGAAERHGGGEATRMAGSFEDVTDRRKAEDEVKKGVRRRDQFLAMLSHELRNPLGAVSNAVAVLSDERSRDERKASAIDVVQRQLRQVTRLLDDLLDVSRITHGKFELRRGSVDLRGAAEQAISVVQSQIEEAELGFSAELCDRPLVVLGDPARLQQVIVNLLTNAIKYTEQGGGIYLGLQWEEGTAILKVRDSGAGIPEEKLGEIFQLFYQSDDTLDRSDGGMGVGLTLVKAVVELHGGSVDVESAGVGCGSQFSVRLPLIAEEDVAEEQLNTPVATPNIRSLVLVEDLDDAREMLASLLLLEGLEVYEAATGTDGLKLIQEVMPDAAIIDIGLPEMDGHSVARAIRSEPRFNNIRLVALTGYGQDSDRLAVTESGFDLHLVKPLDPQKLGDILSGLSRIQKVS